MGGQHVGSLQPVLRFSHHAADRRFRGIDPALRQSQQRQTGLGLSPPLAGPAVRLFRFVELTPQPVQLGPLVEGDACRRLP